MPQVTGLGTTWNLPNYAGELFTADPVKTPLLSMIGGLNGGKRTTNFEFPTAVLYDYPAAAQPDISERASATAPTPSHAARAQEKNVVQIHQEAIDLTYAKMSNSGRMEGLNTAGQQPNPKTEEAFQIQHKLVKIARDVEHSFISGKYQESTADNVANKTRGMLELCSTGSTLDAGANPLTKAMLDTIYRTMADAGASFDNMVMLLPSFQKQAVTAIYASQFGMNLPATRNVGGVNITDIETDFFKVGVVWDTFVPDDSILIVDVDHMDVVFQEVPEKGVLFVEELAKTGASNRKQIYGQLGLAHGPSFLHASITGLTTA